MVPKDVKAARLSPAATLTRPGNEATWRREGPIAINHTPIASLVAAVHATGGHATTAQLRAS